MLLADIEHLPKVVTNINGIRDVLLAIDPEIVALRTDISNFKKELYVRTTELFIERWENDFGLDHDNNLTLLQRRQRILNKLARKRTLTWENLRLLVKSYVINPQFYLVNNSGEYSFKIIVQDEDYTALEDAVKRAKPAYLTFEISYQLFLRRCGTFNCGTEPL